MNNKNKKIYTIIFSLLVILMLPVCVKSQAHAHTLSNPKKNTVGTYDPYTWNYVYFGSYPQTEVKDKATIAAIEKELGKTGMSVGDIRVGNYRYRKVNKVRKHFISDDESVFRYVNEVHYYKWERIKWRVLNVSSNKALLLADKALFAYSHSASSRSNLEWSNSELRQYLNKDFYKEAFSETERKAIKTSTVKNAEYSPLYGNPLRFVRTTATTDDKIYILGTEEYMNENYGFGLGYGSGLKTHENRIVKITDYLSGDEEAFAGAADRTAKFWLRTNYGNNKMYWCWNGRYQYGKESKCHLGVIPALVLDLTNEKVFVKTTFDNKDTGNKLDGNDRFTIKYVLNGGKNSSKNPSEYFVGKGVNKFYEPTRKGYDFLGWYSDKNFKKPIKGVSASSKANLTLYAKWEKYYDPNKLRTVTTTISGLKYKITIKGKHDIKSVVLIKQTDKKASVSIPSYIKYDNQKPLVTAIADNAFTGKKNIKTVVIGKNISSVGKEAFKDCINLRVVNIKTILLKEKTVKADAFENISPRAEITIPAKVGYRYTEMLKKRGIDPTKGQTIITK